MLNALTTINVGYSRKRIEKRAVYDPKEFEPCHGKECEEWSHKEMKTKKYIVHVDNTGKITRTPLVD